MRDAAQLLWMVNLGCIDLNLHPVRADDLEHPEELLLAGIAVLVGAGLTYFCPR